MISAQVISYIKNNYYGHFKIWGIVEQVIECFKKYPNHDNNGNFLCRVKEDELKNNPFTYANYYPEQLFLFEYKNRKYLLGIFCHWQYDRYSVSIKRYHEGEKPKRKKRTVSRLALNVIETKGSGVGRDCQIRTLAAVCNVSYETILKEMTDRGWSVKNVGNHHTQYKGKCRWDEVLFLYGLKKNKIWNKNKHTKEVSGSTGTDLDKVEGISVKNTVKYLPTGKYFISVSGHVCAIVDGKLYDSWNSSNCHVQSIYKIESNE